MSLRRQEQVFLKGKYYWAILVPVGTTPTRLQRRRSLRVVISIPVNVAWVAKEGKGVTEPAHTEVVSAYGGTLWIKVLPPIPSEVELIQGRTRKSAPARVLRAYPARKDKMARIAVELLAPSETFWGPNYQLQKATSELHQLELTIPTENIDSRVLSEFRQAVDYIRQAAWAMQQWMELQAKGRDPYAVLSLLSAERVKRLTKLNKDLSLDLDATEVSFETAGLRELSGVVAALHRRLTRLFNR